MKYIKNFLYIFAVVVVVGIVLCISTAIVQLGTEAIVNAVGFSLKEDWLFSISGGLGTAITGTLCAAYVKKKNYTTCVEVKELFHIKKCLYFSALAWSYRRKEFGRYSFDGYILSDFDGTNIWRITISNGIV